VAQPPVLEVENLSIAYRDKDHEQRVVHGVSFAIAPGEVVALVRSTAELMAGLGHEVVEIPPPVDDAGPVQDVEMPRDVGLGQANLFHDLVDGTLFSAKTGENAQTRRVGQQPEVMRHLLEYLQCLVHAVLFDLNQEILYNCILI